MDETKCDDRAVIERIFKDERNDYVAVLAIARRARQILDDYDRYADVLENEKPTTLALKEFLRGDLDFEIADGAKGSG